MVGLITERYGESWNVDIRGPFPARLDALAFEGVTRRSRPNLQPGDLVYARVTAAARDSNPEIVCTDESGLVNPMPCFLCVRPCSICVPPKTSSQALAGQAAIE